MSRYKEFDEYEELIKERLSKKRFTHSMNVAEACYDLAERFGADKKRCYLAGLLHDIMKEDLPDRQRQMTVDSGMSPDPAEIDTPALWHAVAGAAYVRDRLGIDDEEILAGTSRSRGAFTITRSCFWLRQRRRWRATITQK